MARLCIDSDDFQVSPTGELQIKPGRLGVQLMQVRTANGTFNKADFPDLARVWVRVVGGGGGSAATLAVAQFTGQSGGAGGGYAESIIQASALAASETITVGAGGIAGVAAAGQGGNGGASSFGTHVVATGGQGSSPTANDGNAFLVTAPTVGGMGTAGQIRANGSPGGIGVRLNNDRGYAGYGGDSRLGAGAHTGGAIAPGLPGFNYGGGASGSSNLSGAAVDGAAGAPGVVIIVLIF